MKKLLTFLLVFILFASAQKLVAQSELDEKPSIFKFKGLQYATKDSSFYINFRFRMQNRLGLHSVSGNNLGIDKVDAMVRRLRWRIDGFIMNPKLAYSIQLSFARQDTDFENTGFTNIIRDAVIFYRFNDKFYMSLGQNKLPGNRQRVNSSGQLQFADRSIVNSTFTLDRDFGIKAYYEDNFGKMGFRLKGAISTGEGRSVNFSNNGLAYTTRMEILPMGNFTNSGDYSEGDLEREPTPKVSFGGGASYNHKAQKTGGQLGKNLYEERNFSVYIFDYIFKYKGWALSGEYMQRNINNPITVDDDLNVRYVYAGKGFNQQASYIFKKNYELAARYSILLPNESIQAYELRTDVFELGASKYILKHRVKIQLNLAYNTKNGNLSVKNPLNRWVGLLQVELGI